MAIRLIDLLKRVPSEVEHKVKHVRDQARPVLQETLRTECRLVMRTPDEAEYNLPGAQVPVLVTPGHPTKIWAEFLLNILDQHDPLKAILKIEEDFLGVFEYDPRISDEHDVNRATIKIYWGIVGLVAELMGCPVEDLSVVVLTHELAHAYTQLGADIDGRRWASARFSTADTELKEGLAQYYTERVLRRLERRYGGALKVYQTMLPLQPKAYQTHIFWVENYSPEAVRRAMLEIRRWKEGKLDIFNTRLEEAKKGLQ